MVNKISFLLWVILIVIFVCTNDASCEEIDQRNLSKARRRKRRERLNRIRFPTTSSPTSSPTNSPTLMPTKEPTTSNPTTASPSLQPTTPNPTTASPSLQPTTPNPTRDPTTFAPTPEGWDGYDIQFVLDEVPEVYHEYFYAAKLKWESIIIGDIQSQYVFKAGATCWEDWTRQFQDLVVDDLLIFVNVLDIDGPSKVLGQSGFCRFTEEAQYIMPRVGLMVLDEADISLMHSNGILSLVLIHEIGHILGIGTLWNWIPGLVNTEDSTYTGKGGIEGNKAIGLSGLPKIERNGGLGTELAHWDESSYKMEAMSGYATKGSRLSRLSVLSLQDLGYIVDPDAGEIYKPHSNRFNQRQRRQQRRLRGEEEIHYGLDIIIGKIPVLDSSIPYVNGIPILRSHRNKK